MEIAEVARLIEEQGKAFDAFRKSHEEQIVELKKHGSSDPVLLDRLSKIEGSLDRAVEAKTAIEKAMEAERKEREALEVKLNRLGIGPGSASKEALLRAGALKGLNTVLSAHAAIKNRGFDDLDEKGYDAYRAAAEHYLREGKDNLSAEEVKTLQVGSDPDGGYFVTPDLTGRMVKKLYETSDIRAIADVQVISTDELSGIEDLGEAGAGYAGEHDGAGDTTTPQVGRWRIPVFWIKTEPKATQQLLDDAAVDIEGWLSGKVADKFARFENKEFTTGASNKILGFAGGYATAADSGSGVAWGVLEHVGTGVNGDFSASSPGDRLIDLIGALKNGYLANARFVTRRSVVTRIRKFKDGQGNYLWQPSFVLGTPETILGYPLTRAEDMPALAAGSLSLAFGDFRQGYQVVDREGVRVLRDPYTSKPYVKFYTTKRTGGGVVNFEAIKLLKFS